MSVRDIRVRSEGGIIVETPNGAELRFDPRTPGGSHTVLSHAHADHLPRESGSVICSPLTARLAEHRRPNCCLRRAEHPTIELLPAGHIAGSRAALVRGDRWSLLYTGDICTRSRDYLEGFEAQSADVLIIETTYGRSEYAFPPIEETVRAAHEWLAAEPTRPAILFGYTLGKAQRILRLITGDLDRRVMTTASIEEVNRLIAAELDVEFDTELYDHDKGLRDDDILVLPSQMIRTAWVERLIETTNARTAGFSGWALDRGYRFQRGVDRGFVLSDHCGFAELASVVRHVDPDILYTCHGFMDAFARAMTREGFETRSLRANQRTFSDFV